LPSWASSIQVKFSNPKKAMFRINRDVRFAHDKRPYKTRFSAAVAPNDMRRPSKAGGPTYYMQIDGNGKLLFGAGEYMPPPHRLKALRQHMVDDAAGFRKVLKNKSWWPLWRHPERRQAAASAERLRPGA
jgi:uncharacterized protein (TIGR02453 family)